jgi:LDH2 family malate/lactate/ureidoglycolate dehydrogenase
MRLCGFGGGESVVMIHIKTKIERPSKELIERFMPLAQFRNLMKGYADSIRSSRKAKGTARIYLPGEIESEKEKMSRERGIELSAASLETLNQLLEKVKSSMRL